MERKQQHFLEISNLKCADIEALLDLFLDHELLPSIRPKFEHHIAECQECSALVHDCASIMQIARTLDDPPLPTGVRTRLREVLREKVGYTVPIDLKPRLSLLK